MSPHLSQPEVSWVVSLGPALGNGCGGSRKIINIWKHLEDARGVECMKSFL